MAGVLQKIFDTVPIAVLADRSRDPLSSDTLLGLHPKRVFQITDNRRRLTARRLRDYDVVAICGNSRTPHGPAERKALRAFVRRGGGLVLAAHPGRFELASGLPAARIGGNRIAEVFGFAFLSPSALKADPYARQGFARDELVWTRAGERLGLGLGDICLHRPGSIAVPPGATVLLRQRGGPPVAALARFGRGRVLVIADLEPWDKLYGPWAAVHFLGAVAPERKRPAPKPPLALPRPHHDLRRGAIDVSYEGIPRPRAREIVAWAEKVWREVARELPRSRRPKRWRIVVTPGCASKMSWEWDALPMRQHVGAEMSNAALVATLAEALTATFLIEWEGCSSMAYRDGIKFYVQQQVLKRLGFEAHAERLRSACAGGAAVDLGRFYVWAARPPLLRRFWLEVAAEFGPRAFRRHLAAYPRKEPQKHLDSNLYTGFDRMAFFLATALGPRVYRWLEAHGHTVRRIPLRKPGSDALKKAVEDAMQRIMQDETEIASDRLDALDTLTQCLTDKEMSFDQCARRARSRRPATAIPAAVRLVRARDPRGIPLLRRLLRARDKGMAAVAALALTAEMGDGAARDELVRLAPDRDIRFQLRAGYALECAGDRRHARFRFQRLPGCTLKDVCDDGLRKVYPVVDGYEVANVWCQPLFRAMPQETAISNYYVEWVHTDSRWRRCGLARIAMDRCLDSRWDRECATTGLHTEVRNFGHRLYRSYRLVDTFIAQRLHRPPRPGPDVSTPAGIRIRRARETDAMAVAHLVNHLTVDRRVEPASWQKWPEDRPAFVAYEGRRLVGVISAMLRLKDARIEDFAVSELKSGSKPERRERLGLALFKRLHEALQPHRPRVIHCFSFEPRFDAFHLRVIRLAGYDRNQDNLVELGRVNDLAQFCREIRPALEQRLASSARWRTWTGSILIQGGPLRVLWEIDRGRLRIKDGRGPRAKKATITLHGSEEAVQRMAFGVATPFEEYMQIECSEERGFSGRVTELLETLLPRMITI